MVLDSAIFYNKAHAGVSVQGQSVSGLTQDEAAQKIEQFVTECQSSPMTLTGGGKSWQVLPSQVGAQMDVASAVASALDVTRQGNFFVDMATKLKLYFSDWDVPLQGTVDFALLDKMITDIAKELDQPAVDAGVAIRGTVVAAVKEKEGLVVDQEALRQLITDTALSLGPAEIEVPMVVDEPNIVEADNQTALTQARTMISGPVTLTWGDKSWTFTPEELASYVEFTSPGTDGASSGSVSPTSTSTTTPQSSTTISSVVTSTTSGTSQTAGAVATATPYFSAAKMASRLQQIATETTVAEPKDASLKIVNKKVQVVPGVEGVELDAVKTAEALTQAALKTTERTAEVQGNKQEPEFTTAEVEAMGIKDLLASYSDTYGGSANRRTNVRITTEYILQDGKQFLAPGEEFDFKVEVGPRTPERGYVKAPGISTGMVLEDQYGGGICEVSTAVFNAAFRAGLKITERRNHTMYFDHYPKGMDATVSDPGPNLRFVNDTDHYIWITGKSDGVTTTIEIYGTADGRKVDWEVSKWYGVWGPYTQTTLDATLRTGVSIEIFPGEKAKMIMLYRTITWADGTTTKENFESNYKHQYRIVKVGTATTTTTKYTPPPATTTTVALP
jgi:vancomycin resistance protein YoaR